MITAIAVVFLGFSTVSISQPPPPGGCSPSVTPVINPAGPASICPGEQVTLTATNLPTGGSGAALNLVTTYAGGNGFDGNMFDVVVLQDFIINDFAMNLDAGTAEVEVYHKLGSYAGSETNAGDWTLIGSATGLPSNGAGVATDFGLNLAFPVTVGTHSFYVTTTGTGNSYTNGTVEGALYVSNADMEIYEGIGLSYPFNQTFSPRVWNGTIHYTQGVANYNLSWSPNGETTNSIVADATGSYTVTVDSAGCFATSAPFDLTVTAGPNATFSLNAPDLTANFIDNSSGSPILWSWDFGDGNTSTLQNPTNIYTAAGIYPVTLIVEDANGCTDTVTAQVTINSACALALTGTPVVGACDPATNTYSVDIEVTYSDEPAAGTIDVNGQSFAIGTSPQTVTLVGLNADGAGVDVTATFSDNTGCTDTEIGFFTAPVSCFDACPGATTLIYENFNSCTAPAGWTNNLITGVDPWLFGDNGGNNIDGSCMAYFDDDAIGSAAPDSWVELLSPVVDMSAGGNLELAFDYNYNWIGADSFYVEVWNGTAWDQVLLETSDNTGTWASGPPYANASIPLAGYTNADFQVRFVYNDGGVWAWYLGIDNVSLCLFPLGACDITSVTAGAQTPCDPVTLTYTQEVTVTYTSEPATGNIEINGQSFPITGSPQTETLVGLAANGSPVDVNVTFSADPFCVNDFTAVFVAPPNCFDACPGATQLMFEDFGGGQPAGWTFTVTDGGAWQFGNGDNGISGPPATAPWAYVDDATNDDIGIAIATSPSFDATGADVEVTFDYDYDAFANDADFFVEFYDGTNWIFVDPLNAFNAASTVFCDDDCFGNVTLTAPETSFGNADFAVRWTFNDNGAANSWGLGLDEISFCAVPPSLCDITNITAGAQTPCDPATVTYTQEITVEYTDAPATGTIDINGQSFPITGSPQTETLVGLQADGQPVDVTVEFSDNNLCFGTEIALFTAAANCFEPCPGNVQLLYETFSGGQPAGWTFTVTDGGAWQFGNGDNGVSGPPATEPWAYVDDATNDDIGIAVATSPAVDATGSDVEVSFYYDYDAFANDADFFVEFWDGTNWIFVDPLNAFNAASTVFCDDDCFGTVTLTAPETSFGNADFAVRWTFNDNGAANSWGLGIDEIAFCGVPPSLCSITDISAGTQGPCDPATDTYTQDIIITFTDAPATGTLDVNGQSFAIGTSPQTVTLVGLISDGLPVDVTADFSDNILCFGSDVAVFTAPTSCFEPCPNNMELMWANFNDCQMPAGWSNNLLTGVDPWLFGDNGGNNVDGNCMAYFDDDAIGSAAPDSWIELVTAPVDVSNMLDIQLSFDYNYNHIGADSFYVECWDGVNWNQVLLETSDNTGTWASGPPYANYSSPLVGYTNTDFQVRFVYNDGGAWAWYLGIDNVALCGTPNSLCEITSVTAGAQTPCDPVDNSYTQEVIVEYSQDPGTGTLDVNGQSFPITGSPQTVVLVGLNSDGNPVNVTAVFSDDTNCQLSETALFTAPAVCSTAPCPGLVELLFEDFSGGQPAGWSFTVTDGGAWEFGNGTNGISGPPATEPWAYVNDDANDDIGTAVATSPFVDATGSDVQVTFYYDFDAFANDADFLVQFFNGSDWVFVDQANTFNIGATLFCDDDCFGTITLTAPSTSFGNSNFAVRWIFTDNVSSSWGLGIDEISFCGAPPNLCDITSITAGAQTPCDPATDTYTQELVIEYGDAPATGTLDVNGQSFAITGSPQTVVLTGLVSNGAAVDVNASFSDNTLCFAAEAALFTAPTSCFDPCPGNTTLIWENFNDCQLPAGWTNNAITGDSTWLFVLNSPDAFNAGNIDGTCMALFDDDYVGAGATPSWVELVSAPIDVSAAGNLELSFDYNYNHIGADSFYVEVWNGTAWDQVLLETADNVGTWGSGPPYANATIPLAGYTNTDFQIRFVYNDGGSWAWYVGIDNVALCSFPLNGCEITNVATGIQTPCDPATSTYDQELVITYANAPATGDIIVNGVSFPITGSPQTVNLTGLPADGLTVDVDVEFSADPFCTANFALVFAAPNDCFNPCAGSTTLMWENFNDCQMPAGWTNNAITGDSTWLFVLNSPDAFNAGNIDGTCMALFDDDYVGAGATPSWVELVTAPIDVSAPGELQLSFDYNYNHIGADSFYVEVWDGTLWNQVLLETADNVGTWASGPPYANAVIPLVGYTNTDFQVRFVYNDGGSWAWYIGLDNVALCEFPPTGCGITNVTAGTQTPCDPVTSLYDQEIIVEYTGAPATGDLIVNGQTFPITGSPQTINFTGLISDGLPVDVDVEFSDDPFCAGNFVAVWTAPVDCFDPCAPQTTLLWESFNSCQQPAGWTSNILTGADGWLFVDDSPDPFTNGNIDGTCMVMFDDDFVGAGAAPSFLELISPVVDASSGSNMLLEFDFNYNHIGADSFYVDVWDGANWNNVLLLTGDSIGNWNGGPYPHAVIPLVGYTNADLQVRFVYNDGGVWAWWVAFDNVSICEAPATSCAITAITAGAQTPCDPITNEYTQELIIDYTSDPGTGTLDVNGQSFPVGTSPQTVILTGLNSNGQSVDVTASFSDDIFCELSVNDVFTAPVTCLPIPINDTCDNAITIACGQSIVDSTIYASVVDNPGFCATNLASAPGMWYTFIGDGSQVNITTCSPITNYDTKLGLFEGPCSALVCLDGNDDDFTCVNGGLQSSINNFITTNGTEYLIYVSGFGTATGVFELTLTCAAPCEILNITPGAQTLCDPVTNTYTQEVTVEYNNAPAGGLLDINGQQFAITGSPQTETLIGLLPNSALTDVTAFFTDNANCTFTVIGAWTAPDDCTPPACTDPNAITIFDEDFNNCAQPAGWTNVAVSGDSTWWFVLNSPDLFNAGNIDGTCMALFDDDYLGSGAPASIVELTTPVIDLSLVTNGALTFDYNYNDFIGESFAVDVWDGTAWVNVLTETADNIGTWGAGPPYADAVIDLSTYSNNDFQIRFVYDDSGGNWGWYVGLDNVEVCATPACTVPVTLLGTTYCVGEDSTEVSILEGYTNVTWLPSGSTDQTIWLPAGTYQVDVVDAAGCSASVQFDVTQASNPPIPVITASGPVDFCEGESVVLSAPPGYSSYQWNTGSGTADITVFQSGIYVVDVIDSTGCSSASNSIEVTVDPLPVASFSYSLIDYSIGLTNLSQGANSIAWDFGDGGTSTDQNPTHTYAGPGVYNITLVATNNCGSDTAMLMLGVQNVGIEDVSGVTAFTMYPNPVTDDVVLTLTLAEDRELDISFFDQIGQRVVQRTTDLKTGDNMVEFNLADLATGVYTVVLSSENYSQSLRLVKR